STTSDHHGRYQPLVAGERRGTADERGTACCGGYGGGTAGRDTAAAVRGRGRTGCGASGLLATGGRDGWTGCPAGACGRWRVWSMRPVSSIAGWRSVGAGSVPGESGGRAAIRDSSPAQLLPPAPGRPAPNLATKPQRPRRAVRRGLLPRAQALRTLQAVTV